MNAKFSTLARSLFFTGCLTLGSQLGFAGGVVSTCTQQALEAAMVGGGTVTFACSGTLLLTNTLTVAQDTVIDGNGNAIIISGGNAVRLFLVQANVSARFDNLVLANGRLVGTNGVDGDQGTPPGSGEDVFGAGVLNAGGTLTLVNCQLTNHFLLGGGSGANQWWNGAKGGDASGAAIYSAGVLNLTNCVLAGNKAAAGAGRYGGGYPSNGGRAMGGGVSASGVASLLNVTFSSNTTTGGAPSVSAVVVGNGGPGAGGGIFATNCSLAVAWSQFISNNAIGGGISAEAGSLSSGASGDGCGGAVYVSPGSTGQIEFSSNLGNAATGGRGRRYAKAGQGLGGALYTAGQIKVRNCSFSLNFCTGGADSIRPGRACGGAIFSSNDLSIAGTTLDRNSALASDCGHETTVQQPGVDGAGGAIWSSSALRITNSTLFANSATGGAGGGSTFPTGPAGNGLGGAIVNSGGTVTLVNVTASGNSANGGSDPYGGQPGVGLGGAVFNTNGTFACANSIFANSPTGGNVRGTLSDGGYNISSDNTAAFSAPGSRNNTDPLLGTLADNGGPTLTIALNSGSPAIDAIPAGYPPFDQRGVARPQGSAADIGAFEVSSSNPSVRLATGFEGGNLTISFAAQAGVSYRLLASTNFLDWTSVATNQRPTAGLLQFVKPASARRGIFRVVSP